MSTGISFLFSLAMNIRVVGGAEIGIGGKLSSQCMGVGLEDQ